MAVRGSREEESDGVVRTARLLEEVGGSIVISELMRACFASNSELGGR